MKEIDGTVGTVGIDEMKSNEWHRWNEKSVGMFQWNCNRKYSTDWNDWTEGNYVIDGFNQTN